MEKNLFPSLNVINGKHLHIEASVILCIIIIGQIQN